MSLVNNVLQDELVSTVYTVEHPYRGYISFHLTIHFSLFSIHYSLAKRLFRNL